MPNSTTAFARSEIGFTGTSSMAKADYLSNKIDENKKQPKNYDSNWNLFDIATHPRLSPEPFLTSTMIYVLIHRKLLTILTVFVTTVASKLAIKLPTGTIKFGTGLKVFKEYYMYINKGFTPNCFKLSSVKDDFVLNKLKTLDISKSTGSDNIPGRFLRDRASEMKNPSLINLSIMSNTVPNDFNIARVQPLFKRDNRTDDSYYRPISILCIICKLLEKAVYIQVKEYFTENNILYVHVICNQCLEEHSLLTLALNTFLTDHICSQMYMYMYMCNLYIHVHVPSAWHHVTANLYIHVTNLTGIFYVQSQVTTQWDYRICKLHNIYFVHTNWMSRSRNSKQYWHLKPVGFCFILKKENCIQNWTKNNLIHIYTCMYFVQIYWIACCIMTCI